MGFHSYCCHGCGHPLLHNNFNPTNAWMTQGVAVTVAGSVIRGGYDGYGRLGGLSILDQGDKPDVYHQACWEMLGKPTDYKGGSASARDQGYFFGPKAHNMPRPRGRFELKLSKQFLKKTPEAPQRFTFYYVSENWDQDPLNVQCGVWKGTTVKEAWEGYSDYVAEEGGVYDSGADWREYNMLLVAVEGDHSTNLQGSAA